MAGAGNTRPRPAVIERLAMAPAGIGAPTEAAPATAYGRQVGRRVALGVILALIAIACVLADLAIGSGTLTLGQAVRALLTPNAVDPLDVVILWHARMPVTFTAVLAGIGLALAGSLMQTVLRNPLAEPLTLGISAAAGFGAAMAIVFQASIAAALPFLGGELAVAANAFVFAIAAISLIALLSTRGGLRTETVTLLGIAIHFVFSALLAMAQFLATADQLQGLVFWMLGSLMRSGWTMIGLNVALLALLLPLLLANAWAMTALRAFGDGAVVLGVRVARLRMLLLFAAALLAAGITATVGIVGFVGLVAPHIARLLVGEDQRFALPVTAACGAIVMTAASVVSKTAIHGVVLPIGMVTSLLGVPFFVMLILRREMRGR